MSDAVNLATWQGLQNWVEMQCYRYYHHPREHGQCYGATQLQND